ncbi:MAG: hypothetical protein Q8Q24_00710 [bacterium]|nr:hypothetical protein [bacterium]
MNDLTSDIKKHFQHYLALLVILNLGFAMFYLLRSNSSLQTIAVVATSLAYVFWGIIHHWLADDLHPKVILEYLLFAVLVDSIFISLIFRA